MAELAMSMVTRCPSCTTLFRVTAQQLQVKHGKVRCGHCAIVFDGFRELATLPAPEDPPRVPALPLPPAVPTGFRFEPTEPASPSPPATAVPTPAARAVLRPQARIEPALSASPPLSADALFLQQAHAARRRRLRGWTVGSALLVVTLAVQGAYFYRVELSAQYRPLKPVLLEMCRALQCDVPLPQRPKLIHIEASDVQGIDPARPGLIELTATLRNHSEYDLAYPALDLVLTNTREHTLARRIFLPREYLDRSRSAQAGLPAKAEITIRLALDTGELGAAGFRLDLLPVPAR